MWGSHAIVSLRPVVTLTMGVSLALSSLTSCVEWTTDRQGNLQSIGLPGVPVWQTQTLAEQKRLAAKGDLASIPGATVDPAAARIVATSSDAAWLALVNQWRTAAGVDPVGENVGLSLGSGQHARYLVENGPDDTAAFVRYVQTLGVHAHREEQGNPYWSRAGSEAAQYGGIGWDQDAVADVDGLLIVPFHRLPILAPWAKAAGYGDYGRWPRRAGVLAIRGATPVGMTKPVLFPPDGATMPTGAMSDSEFPNPLAACPGYSYPVGLPITVQLGASVRVRLESYAIEDATTNSQVETCGFDARTYPEEYGHQVLLGYGAIVLVPRKPLAPDHEYRVRVKSHRDTYTWAFRVEQSQPTFRRATRGE